ncbi:MAG: DUF4177 domain-containing protein [Bryobacteraceae bacterium]|nr:DUF4177 domain-containing protein [Bryobacteraceae bacterium]
MKKYEYLMVDFDSDTRAKTLEQTSDKLSNLGEQGWELVAVVRDGSLSVAQSVFYFKRIVPN